MPLSLIGSEQRAGTARSTHCPLATAEDRVRLVFDAASRPAIVLAISDIGDRGRRPAGSTGAPARLRRRDKGPGPDDSTRLPLRHAGVSPMLTSAGGVPLLAGCTEPGHSEAGNPAFPVMNNGRGRLAQATATGIARGARRGTLQAPTRPGRGPPVRVRIASRRSWR
jgi:hypothetical protein